MSESQNDEFDKERLESGDEAPKSPLSADANDPFAELVSAEEDAAEDENTVQRLSHLTPDESVLPDGENTVQRLAALHPDAELVEPEEGENTIARLSHLITENDAAPEGESTTSRIGNFMDSFTDTVEDQESELDGADELSDGELIDSGAPSRGDLTDGLLDPTDPLAAGSSEFGSGDGFDSFDGGIDPMGTEFDSSAAPEAVPSNKKGKKAKGAKKPGKPKKERKVKVVRVKREKQPWTGVDTVVLIVLFFFLLVIAAGNLWALLLAKGIVLSFFLVPFNLFGLVLLLVPYLLWAKKRREGAITFYDTLLALTLALLIFGCMLILSVQARYGTAIKAGASALAVPERTESV